MDVDEAIERAGNYIIEIAVVLDFSDPAFVHVPILNMDTPLFNVSLEGLHLWYRLNFLEFRIVNISVTLLFFPSELLDILSGFVPCDCGFLFLLEGIFQVLVVLLINLSVTAVIGNLSIIVAMVPINHGEIVFSDDSQVIANQECLYLLPTCLNFTVFVTSSWLNELIVIYEAGSAPRVVLHAEGHRQQILNFRARFNAEFLTVSDIVERNFTVGTGSYQTLRLTHECNRENHILRRNLDCLFTLSLTVRPNLNFTISATSHELDVVPVFLRARWV
jgi:hypothetical protein